MVRRLKLLVKPHWLNSKLVWFQTFETTLISDFLSSLNLKIKSMGQIASDWSWQNDINLLKERVAVMVT